MKSNAARFEMQADDFFIVSKKYDPNQPRNPAGAEGGGRWVSAGGGIEHWVGEGTGRIVEGRKFTSDEGYQWHEQGPVKEWAVALPYEDSRVLGTYSGFGYTDINNLRRGTLQEKDEKRLADIQQQADKLDDLIANRGYELPEDITVERGAYLPGVTTEQLQEMAESGTVWEEKGFTSTMVGEAEGRARAYPALGKWESIYKRFPGQEITKNQDEVGTAVRFHITLPAGTKVASIESVRRLEYDFPRVQDPSVFEHPEWTADGKTKPEDYTMRDFTQTPTISTKNLQRKESRSESEVLLGSGARFRVMTVKKGEMYKSGDPTLKPVQVIEVYLEYIGGSSEGRKS